MERKSTAKSLAFTRRKAGGQDIFHDKIINHLKIFHLIGGLPEIVGEYARSKNILNCQQKLGDLLESFRNDFSKYKKRADIQILDEVFKSIAIQSGHKFKYSNVDKALLPKFSLVMNL